MLPLVRRGQVLRPRGLPRPQLVPASLSTRTWSGASQGWPSAFDIVLASSSEERQWV
jgi:hypothetical protein